MTNYFEKCKNADELKATYKELVKKYHPDVYGEKGNEILKDVHNQLEKAVKQLDKGFKTYSNYVEKDLNETAETINLKKELLKEALKHVFPEGALFALYWQHGLRPANHRNPLTKHNFSGWNIWTLEIEKLKNDYQSSEWSTFAQYKTAKNSVKKGEHGTYITLAIIAKAKKEDEDTEEPEKAKIYYKGYTVFNKEQVRGLEDSIKTIETVKAITTKKEPVQKTLNLWSEKYEVIA